MNYDVWSEYGFHFLALLIQQKSVDAFVGKKKKSGDAFIRALLRFRLATC